MSIASGAVSDKLADLRNRRKQAIQALDFETAEDIDRQIKEAQEGVVADRITKIFEEILKDLTDYIAKYEKITREITE